MFGSIYHVFHDGRLGYVGQTTRALSVRWKKHLSDARCGRDTPLASALRKHGAQSFVVQVAAPANSRAVLDFLEVSHIHLLEPRYNACAGGKGLGAPSAETRQKIAVAMRARVFSAQHRSRISEGLKGRPVSDAQRQKLKTSLAGRSVRKTPLRADEVAALVERNKARRMHPVREELQELYVAVGATTRADKIAAAARHGYVVGTRKKLFGADNPAFGTQKTAEQRLALSDKMRADKNPFFGAVHSEDTRAKMSAAHAARPEVECPHCGVRGRSNAMLRWHFDNCRSK